MVLIYLDYVTVKNTDSILLRFKSYRNDWAVNRV